MKATVTDVDYMSAPKDYAAVFAQYYPYVVNLCAKFGIDDNNKEDVASDIMLRFMERGSLEKFDPDRSFAYRGTGPMRPARFKNYLSRAVDMYCRGHRDRQAKLARRELQIVDKTQNGFTAHADAGSFSVANHATWGSVFGEQEPDPAEKVLDMIDEAAEADGVRSILAGVPPRSTHDTCDLVALYNAVRMQVICYGEYDINVLREKFQVGSTTMHGWVWWLKHNLAHIYGVPVPAKRPRRTRSNTEQPEPDEAIDLAELVTRAGRAEQPS